jgi:uncharacterized protein YjlB
MAVWDSLKGSAERITGLGRPSAAELPSLVRSRKANLFRFDDDGVIPNHPRWPLIVYRGAVRFGTRLDPAAVLEDLFADNGWRQAWRNGVYDYVHYHSRIHEVLGVARGSAEIRFGGNRGRKLAVKAGDVAVLPAGTGHKCLSHCPDFLVVGAYPGEGTYDLCRTSEDHDRAVATIPKVPRPKSDPVYGAEGPLLHAWR